MIVSYNNQDLANVTSSYPVTHLVQILIFSRN